MPRWKQPRKAKAVTWGRDISVPHPMIRKPVQWPSVMSTIVNTAPSASCRAQLRGERVTGQRRTSGMASSPSSIHVTKCVALNFTSVACDSGDEDVVP